MAQSVDKRKSRSNPANTFQSGKTDANGSHENGSAPLPDKRSAAPPVAPSQLAEQAVADDGRAIVYVSHKEDVVNDQAAKALASYPGLYQRGGELVQVIEDASPAAGTTRHRLRPRIRPLSPPTLREILAKQIDWRKYKTKQSGEIGNVEGVGAHPPGHAVQALHNRGKWDGIPHLEGVVDHPVFLPNGTVLRKAGYHAETGLLQTYNGPPINLQPYPTLHYANMAVRKIKQLFVDFPFESEVYFSGFLAALLSPLARPAYHGPTPLFLVDANVRSAGKGMLLNCIGRIIYGRNLAVTPCPKEQDNQEKLITSMVRGGYQYVLFDNLSGKFGNDALESALTTTEWQTRILGGNEIMNAPLNIIFFATGNNVQLTPDMTRRCQHIRLNSPLSHPENRQDFVHPDILSLCSERRGELLKELLTILVAFDNAGRPEQKLIRWGSYEEWSKLIRSALVWAGLPDPALALRPLQVEADEESGHLEALAALWEWLDPQHKGMTTKEFIREINCPTGRMPPDEAETGKNILEELMNEPDPRKLGALLKKHQKRNFGGRIFKKVGEAQRYAKWAAGTEDAFRKQAEQTHQTHQTHSDGTTESESGEFGESVPLTQNLTREPGEEG